MTRTWRARPPDEAAEPVEAPDPVIARTGHWVSGGVRP
jgi:hypothetical protein